MGKIKCHKCNTETSPTSTYCPNCGADMDSKRNTYFCIRCGQPLESGAKYCAYCREPVPKIKSSLNEEYTNLVEQAISGDINAFQQLYEKQYNNLYYVALSMLRNPHDAEDITQNTFVQAWKSIKTLQSPYAFKGWITRILSNNCMDLIRKKKTVSFETEETLGADELWEDNIEFLPADILDKAETRRLIREIIDNLSDVHKQVIILHYFQLLSVKEIADIENITEGTVKSRLYYARDAIKSGVEEHEKKGIKLYTITGLPLLTLILRDIASETALPPESIGTLWNGVKESLDISASSSAVSTTATETVKSTGVMGKIAGTSVATKIIAGIIAVSLVAGTAIGINALTKEPEETIVPVEVVAEEPAIIEAEPDVVEENSEIQETEAHDAALTWQDKVREEILEGISSGFLLEDASRVGSDTIYASILAEGPNADPYNPTLLWRMALPDGSDADWGNFADIPHSERLTIKIIDNVVQAPTDAQINEFINSYPINQL